MYNWLLLGVIIVICVLAYTQQTQQIDDEGFSNMDLNTMKAQRQQQGWEGERRYNDFARMQASTAIIPADSVDTALRQVIPVSSKESSSLLSMLSSTLYGAADDGTNKVGDTLEQTGVVQQKINFCESVSTSNCNIFDDPRYAECGICHTDGISSKGGRHRGGMYISAEDQYRANELAKTTGGRAVYNPTIGTCPAGNFTVFGDSCVARGHELDCIAAGAPSANNECGLCYGGGSTDLIYMGPKPLTYTAVLHVSHPGTHSVNGSGMIIKNSNGNTASLQASTKGVMLDPQQTYLELREGDQLQITIYGAPLVWCAWLASVDGKRIVSLNIGVKSVAPSNGFAIAGDKQSARVRNAMAKIKAWNTYKETVPSTVLWYMRRNEVVPPAIVSAWYGMYPPVQNSAGNGNDVTSMVQELAGRNGNIVVQNMMNGDPKADYSNNSVWLTRDDGSVIKSAEGTTIPSKRIYNAVNIAVTVPATLAGPYYDINTAACAAGPMVLTEVGAGIMGAHSCFTASGAFNPSIYCMTELFMAAGGLPEGTAYPDTLDKAKALVLNDAKGKPSLEMTVDKLNNMGSIALYGVDDNGAPAGFAAQKQNALSMLGVTMNNPCDGPSKSTGPHTAECLNYLWKTSGNPGQDASKANPDALPYAYCPSDGGDAPISKGAINLTGIQKANDIGGINEVRNFYNSMYNRSQDSSDFDVQAAAMKSCYGVKLEAKKSEPTVCPAPKAPSLPQAVNGLVVWYDGMDPNGDGSSGVNAQPVYKWVNKTGNSQYDAIAGNRPLAATYSASSKALNFSGSSLYETKYPGNPTSETIFVVFNIANPNIHTCTLIGGSPGGRGIGLGFNGLGTPLANGMINMQYRWQSASPSNSYKPGTTAIMTSQIKGGTSYISADGGAFGSGDGTYNANTWTWLGSELSPPNTYNYNGYAMEILIYNSALSTSQIQRVEGYLAWKWGTHGQLPYDHPYKNVSPEDSKGPCDWISAAVADTWKQMDGYLVQASISEDDTIVGVNSGMYAYSRKVTGAWADVASSMTQIDTKGGFVVGITDKGIMRGGGVINGVVKWDPDALPGAAGWISIGADKEIWHTSRIGGLLFRWNAEQRQWQQIPGGALQVAVGDKDNVWIVGGNSILHYWTGSTWLQSKTPALIKYVSVSPGGRRIAALGVDGNIYASADKGGSWKQIPGNFDGYVSVGDNYILAGNRSNQFIYTRKLSC